MLVVFLPHLGGEHVLVSRINFSEVHTAADPTNSLSEAANITQHLSFFTLCETKRYRNGRLPRTANYLKQAEKTNVVVTRLRIRLR